MASESIAHSAFGLMGYWLRAHSGSRNNCKISLACSRRSLPLLPPPPSPRLRWFFLLTWPCTLPTIWTPAPKIKMICFQSLLEPFREHNLQGSYSFQLFTFHNFPWLSHDLLQFSMTFGLAFTFKNFQTYPCFKAFEPNSIQQTQNAGVHQNMCCSHY